MASRCLDLAFARRETRALSNPPLIQRLIADPGATRKNPRKFLGILRISAFEVGIAEGVFFTSRIMEVFRPFREFPCYIL
jgi:hypothetical protein